MRADGNIHSQDSWSVSITPMRVSAATRDTLNEPAHHLGHSVTTTADRAARLPEEEALGKDLAVFSARL